MSGLKRNHRNINAELNLTTFIDLLSTIVCFLLISAVWVQVGSLEIKQSHGSAGKASEKNTYELELKYVNANAANFIIKNKGRRIYRSRIKETSPETLTAKIETTLEKWLNSKRGKAGEIATAMITPKLEVTYGNLVTALDTLRKYKIVNIGIVPTKGGF